MRRKIWQFSVMALIVGGIGCQHHKTAVNGKQPPDPLLISKKPVDGKPTSYEPASVTWREPKPPAEPVSNAVVQQPNTGRSVPVGYRPSEDSGAAIGKPRWLPNGQ